MTSKEEIQKVLDAYARRGAWKNWDEFEIDAGGDGYPEMIKEAVTLAYQAGALAGKKELVDKFGIYLETSRENKTLTTGEYRQLVLVLDWLKSQLADKTGGE